MCSSVWSLLSPVFLWKFVCYLYSLQYDSALMETFHSKVFFEKWNGNEKPKKKSQKRDLGKDKWYNQMGQVGTSWSTWDKWDKEKGSSDLSGTVGQGEGCLQICVGQVGQGQGVCPLEPFHLSQMGLQWREKLPLSSRSAKF